MKMWETRFKVIARPTSGYIRLKREKARKELKRLLETEGCVMEDRRKRMRQRDGLVDCVGYIMHTPRGSLWKRFLRRIKTMSYNKHRW